MSIPYGVAVGLLEKAGLEQYDDAHVEDQVVRTLVNKVYVQRDDLLSAQFPRTQALS